MKDSVLIMKLIKNIITENINLIGKLYLCEANSEKGFNFPYTLFVPDNIDINTSLIVEGANTGKSNENIDDAIDEVIHDCMNRIIIECNSETNFPILTPCFPRIYTKEDGCIYTHMLTSKVLNYEKNNLKRIDIQLVNMIDNAKEKLMELGINSDHQVILDGFSASAKFVNRFALLHPEIVKLVTAGACSGTGILPIKEIAGEKLLYPIGCGNLDITDK